MPSLSWRYGVTPIASPAVIATVVRMRTSSSLGLTFVVVGISDGSELGLVVGTSDKSVLGLEAGMSDGPTLGLEAGMSDGPTLGLEAEMSDGPALGLEVLVGAFVATVGRLDIEGVPLGIRVGRLDGEGCPMGDVVGNSALDGSVDGATRKLGGRLGSVDGAKLGAMIVGCRDGGSVGRVKVVTNGSIHLSELSKTWSNAMPAFLMSIKNLSYEDLTVLNVILPDVSMNNPINVIDSGDNMSKPHALNQSEARTELPPSRFTLKTVVRLIPSGLFTLSSLNPAGLQEYIHINEHKRKEA